MSTRRSPDDFAAEVDAHLALEIERLVNDGLDPAEAAFTARRRFGSPLAARERFYETQRIAWLDQLRQDLKLAVRALTRYPVACAVAVASLALGIGATTATLAARDAIFRKPPPLYRDPEQLSRIQVGSPERPIRPASQVPGALFARWSHAPVGAETAAAAPTRVREFRTDDRADTIRARGGTANIFTVLGVDAAIGRASLTPGSVVLSHRAWRTIFDSRSDVAGRTIWIDNQPFTVAGVMPERFWFATTDSAIWTLLDADGAGENVVEVVARRNHGITPSVLARQLESGLADYAATLPAGQRQLRLLVTGIEGTPIARSVQVALPWLLAAAVLLTLVIACANVAILVIAQWTAREHEIAIRASLGASRSRIVRALVAETTVIAGVGGALGNFVTLGLLGIIARNAGGDLRFFDLSIEPHVFIESLAITMAAGVAAGIGPALLTTRRLIGNPMLTLATSDRVRQRWRHGLVVLEIAVTVALLVVTGGMLGTYRQQLSRDVGFDTHPLIALRVENNRGVPAARVAAAILAVPGVVATAGATSVPYMGFGPLDPVSIDASGNGAVRAERVSIEPSFFAALGVPMRAGRLFTAGDAPAARAAIVNERLASRLFPGENAIGRQVWLRGTSYEIVGVSAQYVNVAAQGTDWDPKIYLPLAAGDLKQMTFIVRAPGAPAAAARVLRRAVRDSAAGNVVANLYTMDEWIAISRQEILVGTAPLAPLTATGMLLTAAGIYGVLAFAVARRSRELALRVAIGATRKDIVHLVAAHSLRIVATGTVIGIGATFALSRIARASGGGGSFLDPEWPAFVVPAAIIAAIAIVATYAPSRRAVKIDPAEVLRTL